MQLPEKFTKRYYTIGELAKMLEVAKSNIRYWEREFEMLQPAKTSGGERRYTAKDVEDFVLVYRLLKEQGYTIDGARRAFSREKKRVEMIQRLDGIRAGLLSLKKDLLESQLKEEMI